MSMFYEVKIIYTQLCNFVKNYNTYEYKLDFEPSLFLFSLCTTMNYMTYSSLKNNKLQANRFTQHLKTQFMC